jgi:hypothetical protein
MADADEQASSPYPFDTSKPSIARTYDYLLGGKDNFAVDRAFGDRFINELPGSRMIAYDNRGALIRAVQEIVTNTPVRQFIDLGSGLPTADNVHQVAQRHQPESKVVYVDNDPVVLAHGRALLEENDNTHFVAADIFQPSEILDNETVRKHIDFTEPVALLQMGTLHHFNGAPERPAEIMREYIEALPSGSYVGISHFSDPEDELSALARKMEDVFLHSPMGSGTFRTKSDIEDLFPGLELVKPGVTLCADWWPDGPRLLELNDAQRCISGGVGRKP